MEKLTSTIKSALTSLDFYILKRTLSHNVCKAANRVIKTHQKKLENLTRNAVLPFTSDETVTNISSHHLTPEQLSILKFGLTYSIRPPKINTSDVHTCFELIHHTRGIEWSIQNDASRKISAESRNLGIQNKSLGLSGSLHVEPSRSLEFL